MLPLTPRSRVNPIGAVCWPSGSDLPCEAEVCTVQESGIINHSPGSRVPEDEPFFGKSEHVTVILTVGAQGYRECPGTNVLRCTPQPDDGQMRLLGVVSHFQVESNARFTSDRDARGSAWRPAWPV